MTKIITKKDALMEGAKTLRMEKAAPAALEKQASENFNSSRLMLGEQGVLGLAEVSGQIYEQSKAELRGPQAIQTFYQMSLDPVIAAAQGVIDIMVAQVQWHFESPPNASEQSKEASRFLNHCMHNMVGQSWAEFINDVGSLRVYGYSIAEKVFTRATKGEWAGKLKWKRLPGRSQRTVSKWLFDPNTQDLLGVEQNPSYAGASYNTRKGNPITIDRNKFLLFRYDPKRDNPEGNSPLIKAWISWKYKTFLEELEGITFSKDMSGIMHIQVDVNFLQKATLNPAGQEAATLNEMRKNAANFHKGDQSYLISPLAYNQEGKELFKVSVLGVEGSGKKDSIDVAIKRKQTEILMIYLADVLQLGNQSHGSFSLADAKTNLLGLAVAHHLKIIAAVISNDLLPQTLAINGYSLSEEDMPILKYGDVEDVDPDVVSQFIQRVSATQNLPRTRETVNEILAMGGFTYRIPEGTSEEAFVKLFPENRSRSGDSAALGGGNGTSTSAAARDNSTANKSN